MDLKLTISLAVQCTICVPVKNVHIVHAKLSLVFMCFVTCSKRIYNVLSVVYKYLNNYNNATNVPYLASSLGTVLGLLKRLLL